MIIDVLKEKFPELARDIRVRDIVIDKNAKRIECTVTYPDISSLPDDVRKAVQNTVRESVPPKYYCMVPFKNDYFTEAGFLEFFTKTIAEKFVLLSPMPKSDITVKRSGDRSFSVELNVARHIAHSIEAMNFVKEFQKYLAEYTTYEADFTVRERENVLTGNQEKYVSLAVSKELNRPKRYVETEKARAYIGSLVTSKPMYISDIRSEKNDCTVCGVIAEKSTFAAKSDLNLVVCKFVVKDPFGGTLPAVLFVRYKTENIAAIKELTGDDDSTALEISSKNRLKNEKLRKKVLELYDGTEVILNGKVVKNNFSHALEMQVYRLSLCKIKDTAASAVVYEAPPDEYIAIFPKKREAYVQETLIQNTTERVNYILENKVIVVINVDSTGFDVIKDKIIAVAFAKIINGTYIESLSTYVNPEEPVSNDLPLTSGITSDKLVLYPTLTELIPDLYKFCYGATLVGMTVDETVKLLNYYAEPAGYRFSNKTVKQNNLISDLYDNSAFSKKANCSKISDVAKSCRVEYDGAGNCFSLSDVAAKCIERLGESK